MKEIIPIFFAVDNNYVPFLAVALTSIINNASTFYNYKIHIIQEGITEENMLQLKSLENDNFKIKFYSIQKSLSDITDRSENHLRCDYFTMTIYFRLFIPEMFPEYEKGIYIDSDIVVPGDISELYNIDISDNYIGACPDHSVVEVPQIANYMENGIGIDKYHYINSGVLLMNLHKLREKKLSEKFLKLLKTYHFDCIAPDQDYLNAMCYGNIEYIDKCWDVMPNKSTNVLHNNPKLIHYNLFDKPWCYDNVQYEQYFWKYAKETTFYDELIEYKNNYSNKQKQSDKEAFNRLLEKADNIPKKQITFKKMYEDGVDIRL